MFRNYLIIALRHFWANKSYVIVNVLGLAVGIVISILAYYHFAYDLEFDDQYKGSTDNIYRVEKHLTIEGQKVEQGMLRYPLIKLIANNTQGVKQVIRYNETMGSGVSVNIRMGDNFFTEDVFYADSGFFKVFKQTFIKGNENAFSDKTSIILNERAAKKYFGSKDPIGKRISLIYNTEKKGDFIVRAIIKDQPFNSSFQFNVITRFENCIELLEINESDWLNWRESEVYVEIPDPNNVALLNKQFESFVKTHNDIHKEHHIDKLSLLPFKEVAQHSPNVNNKVTNSIINPAFVIMICSIALLILLIACFNYTNTSIALASTRIKEISLRKVMGSQRKNIIWQFLLEHFVISLLAVLVSFILSDFVNPLYWNLWSQEGDTFSFSSYKYLVYFVIFILLFTTLISGAYPAFYISKLKTADALRRNLKLKGGNLFTYVLLGFQLVITIIGLGLGILFYDNSNYIDKIHKGYSVENIIAVPIGGGINGARNFELFKSRIMENPDILAAAGTSQHIGWGSWMEKTLFNEKEFEAVMLPTGVGYLQTMGVKLTEGRFFENDNTDDTNCVILNEKYVKTANISNPLNESITLYGKKRRIIGIVGDFMQHGVSRKVKPMLITVTKSGLNILAVKTSTEKLSQTNKFLEKKWKETFPDQPYDGYPQQKNIDMEKREFGIMQKIFLFVSAISLTLSLVGLYVLIALIINKKTKEIGIRKVLGSSIQNIILILGKNFLYIFGTAALIGSFLGITLGKLLLDDLYRLDNHVDITPVTFLLSSLAITIVAAFTISYKVIKAANANPVMSLRTE